MRGETGHYLINATASIQKQLERAGKIIISMLFDTTE